MERKKRTILEIRKNKKQCDWMRWKGDYSRRACIDFNNCLGCGAYGIFAKSVEEMIKKIKKEARHTHIREVLEQYDEGLLLDLLQYFFNQNVYDKNQKLDKEARE